MRLLAKINRFADVAIRVSKWTELILVITIRDALAIHQQFNSACQNLTPIFSYFLVIVRSPF